MLRQRHVRNSAAIFFGQRHIQRPVMLVQAETVDGGELDRIQTLAATAAQLAIVGSATVGRRQVMQLAIHARRPTAIPPARRLLRIDGMQGIGRQRRSDLPDTAAAETSQQHLSADAVQA